MRSARIGTEFESLSLKSSDKNQIDAILSIDRQNGSPRASFCLFSVLKT